MRYGTFLCWLFGHKMALDEVIFNGLDKDNLPLDVGTRTVKYDFCLRCGAERT